MEVPETVAPSQVKSAWQPRAKRVLFGVPFVAVREIFRDLPDDRFLFGSPPKGEVP